MVGRSNVMDECHNESGGNISKFNSGGRFLYAQQPQLNLHKQPQLGEWKVSIYYKGRIRPDQYTRPQVEKCEIGSEEQDSESEETSRCECEDEEGEIALEITAENLVTKQQSV